MHQANDDKIIALGCKMAELHAPRTRPSTAFIEEGTNIDAEVDSAWDEMATTYDLMLQSPPPASAEGQRALAPVVLHRCSGVDELWEPQSDYARGVAVLLSALTGAPDLSAA